MSEYDDISDMAVETTALLSSPKSTSKTRTNVNYTALNNETEVFENYNNGHSQADESDNNNNNDYINQSLDCQNKSSYKILLAAILFLIVGLCTGITSFLDILTNMVCKDYYKAGDNDSMPIDSPLGPIPSPYSATIVAFNQTLLQSDPRCNSAKITSLVGIFQTYISTTSLILNLVSIPLLSSYADRWGRKPILFFSGFYLFLSTFLCLAVCVWPDAFNYRTLLLTGVLDGIGGSMTMIIIMSSSYIADTVKESQRAKILSIQDAIYSGGMAIGPIIGSYILATTNDIKILFSIGCVSVLAFLFIVVFILPESRSEKSRRQSIAAHVARKVSFLETRKTRLASSEINEEDISIFSKVGLIEKFHDILHSLNFVEPLKVLKFSNIKNSRFKTNAYLLIIAQTLMSVAVVNGMPFIILLAKARFQWTSVQNNYLVSILGGTRFFTLSLVLPRIFDYMRLHWSHSSVTIDHCDKTIFQASLTFSTLGYFLISKSNTGHLFMFSMCFLAFGSGTSSVIRNSLIKYSPPNKVAEVLGAANMITTILSVFTPTLFAQVYKYTAEHRPQAVIEILVVCELVVFIVVCFLYVKEDGDTLENEE